MLRPQVRGETTTFDTADLARDRLALLDDIGHQKVNLQVTVSTDVAGFDMTEKVK